jgi:DNA polymerase
VAAKKREGAEIGKARTYFLQQREGGERDLIVGSQAVAALGAAPAVPPAATDWRDVLRNVDAVAAAPDTTRMRRASVPAPATPLPSPPPPGTSAVTATVRGGSARGGRSGSEGGSAAKRSWHSDLALEHIAAGLTVGSSSHDMFEGTRDGFASLGELERAVAACKRCGLYRGAKNPVPGEGDPNADLMCVGEAPGATEDELGRPFVGQAGRLLTQILAAIDLPREKVYICNVLKHRPPNNRNPLPDEVTACQPYLVRQIELIRPKVILALGTFAAQTLLDTKLSMGKLREALHTYHGIPLVVTYHPAALLRNPSWKRPTWEDVQLARRFLDRAVVQRGT